MELRMSGNDFTKFGMLTNSVFNILYLPHSNVLETIQLTKKCCSLELKISRSLLLFSNNNSIRMLYLFNYMNILIY